VIRSAWQPLEPIDERGAQRRHDRTIIPCAMRRVWLRPACHVSGRSMAGRLLLDGDVERGGRATLARIPLLAQSAERRRLARDVPGVRRREPAAAGIARADDRADAPDQRAVPVRGDGGGWSALNRASAMTTLTSGSRGRGTP